MNLTWQNQRIMSPHEFRVVMDELGLSRSATARYLGVSNRTATRWAKGEMPIPEAAALLLRVLVAYNIEPLVPKWKLGQY